MEHEFKEDEMSLVGKIRTSSGAIAIADGIWGQQLRTQGIKAPDLVTIDTENDDAEFPVYTTIAGNKRYIIIAIDEAVAINSQPGPVEVDEEDAIEVPEEPPTDTSVETITVENEE
jgi:hypothetical protein